MPLIEKIQSYEDDLTDIRRDIHAHPEIGFEEVRTSGIVADKLTEWGIETHTGIGKTGVVGVLQGARPGRMIGLRADMDALPIEEMTNLPHRSTNPGVMHACGHDGHTTMLLGAARYLAETRDFAGTAVFIFQPAEEGLGGARAMLADGLFDKFPVEEVYGLHNNPYMPLGKVSIKPGAAMAGAEWFDFHIKGKGAHGAMPQAAKDPVIVATHLVQALQTVVSRNADPRQAAVLSVTQIHSGAAYNVIPETAHVAGTARMFSDETRALIVARMKEIAAGVAATFDVEITPDIRDIFTVLENDPALSDTFIRMAAEMVGEENTQVSTEVVTGSEDFADMLQSRPGAYFVIGQDGPAPLHNDGFDFNDKILTTGASLLARIIETRAAA